MSPLAAEVLAISTRALRDIESAAAAEGAQAPSPQAALDRVTALLHERLGAKDRHIPIREVFAAIDGRTFGTNGAST